MISSPRSWTEAQRLSALQGYDILDTPQEKDFDDVVQLVTEYLEVPIAAVNLIDEKRQWFKSEIGLGVREMPLDDSICKFALLADGTMIVPDTRADPRFAGNPLVTGEPGLRFYAGALLLTPEGTPLGTLCALDYSARPDGLSERQSFLLKTLARQIMSLLELRRAFRRQNELLAEQASTQEALLAADRKKDEFLAMLAHELRNPLAPIAAAAQFLGVSDNPARMREMGAVIARQAGHLTALVDDLLDVSRVTQGKITLERMILDLRDIVADAVEQVSPLIEKHKHALTVQLPPAPALVDGDRNRLVQVLSNLLSNAAKYTSDGGRIDVDLHMDTDNVVVAVRDNGTGMTPDLLNNAFDLFSQAARSLDRSQGGLGIGLSLVKNLLHLHAGSIRAESEGPHRGSRFIVQLPRVHAEAPVRDQAVTPGEKHARGGLRIAVVDDNEDAAAMLAMLLESMGHETLTLHSPTEAIRVLPTFAPHVCLLDIGLPEINGFALARMFRDSAAMSGSVLAAITGYDQEQDRKDAADAGFDELFVKPVDFPALQRWLSQFAGSAANY